MLESILKNQTNYFLKLQSFRRYNSILDTCIDILNHDTILQVSGLKYTWKTEIIAEMIRKTNMLNNFFYFHPEIDTWWYIKNSENLMLLMDYRIRTIGKIDVVILEDCNKIKDIKSFILKLYASKNFKIVIIGNNIKIQWAKEINIFPLSYQNIKKDNYIYGGLPYVRVVPNNAYKKIFLRAVTSDILEKEIFIPYNIKNQDNYRRMLVFLAWYDWPLSIREMHRLLQSYDINISLITLIEYINTAITTQILIKQELYDIKKKSLIHTQSSYQFWDLGIRNVFWNFNISWYINILACEYVSYNYRIYVWKFWTFQFDIYAIKWEKKIGVIMCQSEQKTEVKKFARRLSKVSWLTNRYVLVADIEKLHIRKYTEHGVEICELDTILQNTL